MNKQIKTKHEIEAEKLKASQPSINQRLAGSIRTLDGKIKMLMKQAVRIVSLVILAGFAYKGVAALWLDKPSIGSVFAILVVILLLYAHLI